MFLVLCLDEGTKIAFIHDTRHPCTRFRIDGIKAMSRSISGGKQVIKFADTENHVGVCLLPFFKHHKTTTLVMQNVQFEFRQVLPAVRTTTVATTSQTSNIITYTHNLPFSSFRGQSGCFLGEMM